MYELTDLQKSIFNDLVIPDGTAPALLMSAAISAWANTKLGQMPPNFGEGLTLIGDKLGGIGMTDKMVEVYTTAILKDIDGGGDGNIDFVALHKEHN